MDASIMAIDRVVKSIYDMFTTKERNTNFAQGLLTELKELNKNLISLSKETGLINMELKSIRETIKH